VFFDLDNLIIETYRELMAVLLGLAVIAVTSRLVWLTYLGRKPVRSHILAARTRTPAASVVEAKRLEGDARQFTRLDAMISGVIERAEQVSATQSQVALKLDTIEMAMHRLHTDVEGLVAIPKHMPPPMPAAVATNAMQVPRATRAA
jgi:hypothetical protein